MIITIYDCIHLLTAEVPCFDDFPGLLHRCGKGLRRRRGLFASLSSWKFACPHMGHHILKYLSSVYAFLVFFSFQNEFWASFSLGKVLTVLDKVLIALVALTRSSCLPDGSFGFSTARLVGLQFENRAFLF